MEPTLGTYTQHPSEGRCLIVGVRPRSWNPNPNQRAFRLRREDGTEFTCVWNTTPKEN